MTSDHSATAADRDRLKTPAEYHNATRNCDVVMKGGITSGVVYPLAACELATKFHFRNVGGTSAGAIAAAAAAAAEHGRLQELQDPDLPEDPQRSFAGLAEMQEWLSADKHLVELFQPNRATSGIYDLLLAFISKPAGWDGRLTKWALVLWQLLRVGIANWRGLLALFAVLPGLTILRSLEWAPGELWLSGGVLLGGTAALAVALLALARRRVEAASFALLVWAGLMWWMYSAYEVAWAHWAASVGWLLAFGGLLLGVAVSVGWQAIVVLPDNNFGLVKGSRIRDSTAPLPLSDWFTRRLNRLAGLPEAGDPLTFGQLWTGPRAADPSEEEWAQIVCSPAINLEMLTTCLSEGRPYRMPRDFGSAFYFRPEELEEYVPKHVVEFMLANPSPATDSDEVARRRRIAQQFDMYPLPAAHDLPVILATRMSLSFPGLISAVPLYSVDYTYMVTSPDPCGDETDARATDRTEIVPERTWFSDGGITSNFPVSFFDALLPRWPTFGINLRPFHPAYPKLTDPPVNEACHVYLPRDNTEGILAWRTRMPRKGFGAIAGFAGSILDTMQNWADNAQLQVPGFRDRVAHISHDESEGGMNLDMPSATLHALSERGRSAGARLAHFYTQEPTPGESVDCLRDGEPPQLRRVGWSNHRWVRMRSTLAMLERTLRGLHAGYAGDSAAGIESYRDEIETAAAAAPSYAWETAAQWQLAQWLMEGTEPKRWPPPPGQAAPGGLMGLAGELDYYARHKPTNRDATPLPAGPAEAVAPNKATHLLGNGAPAPQPELRPGPGHRRDC